MGGLADWHGECAFAGAGPEVGSKLPEFQLLSPAAETDREYLGLGNSEKFSMDQVNAQLVLIEIVGVFCPQCHIQAPLFNTLFQRLKKNPEMGSKIKMVAIAIGATPMEVDYMREQFSIGFPLTRDPDFAIHKLLGEPRTPFIMIVAKDKKVIFTHLGVISDMDAFFVELQKLLS